MVYAPDLPPESVVQCGARASVLLKVFVSEQFREYRFSRSA